MRTKWMNAVIVAALLLQGAGAARGQEAPRSGVSIAELKEQIARLASVESDETVPADVKALNRKFLEERRAQLRALLQKNLDATRTYRATVASSLTADELAVVDGSIQSLEKELQGLPPDAAQPASTRAAVSSERLSASSEVERGAAAASPATPAPSRALSGRPTSPAPAPPAVAPQDINFAPEGSDPNEDDAVKDDIKREIASLAGEVSRAGNRQERMEAFDITANPLLFSRLLALNLANTLLTQEEFVKDVEAGRIDKQVGGSATNAGSTTLVSKGGVPAAIGFAVENGGLTRAVDGTTVTLRGNPVGLFESFQGTGFIPSFRDDSQSTRLLRKLSFSVSFDTSRGETPGTFLANRQQLSGYSLRYEFKNDRDPRNEKYKRRWENLVRGHANAIAPRPDPAAPPAERASAAQRATNNIGRIQRFIDTHPAYVNWLNSAKEAVANASAAELAQVIARQFEAFQSIEVPPELAALVEEFQTDFTAYRRERDELLDIIDNAPIITLEYVNDRRPGLIDTSTLNFIAETGLFEGKADLTYNGSFTFFNSDPGAGMKRVRNFDNSLRLDMPIGDPRKFGGVLTFAGQYKRLLEDDMDATGTLKLSTKGDMATGQLLFTLPIRGTGFKIPLSLSFANRSEFIREKEIRGNFGFTFDIDSILQNLKPF